MAERKGMWHIGCLSKVVLDRPEGTAQGYRYFRYRP